MDKVAGKQYALFDKQGKQRSEWYVKLGACLLDRERGGKRFVVKDEKGNEVKHR